MHYGATETVEEALAPWAIEVSAFPTKRSDADKLLFLINYAVLAPSSHNAQPWRFRLCDRSLKLYADPARALPVADPMRREQIISCSAALFNIRVALHRFGFCGEIETLPDVNEPDLLAHIRLGDRTERSQEYYRLFDAIPKRHTVRFPFEDRLLPETLITDLETAARLEGASLILDSKYARQEIASLVAEGDRRQYEDLCYRKELASWVHTKRSQRRDGLPGYAFGAGRLLSYVGPLATWVFNNGESRGQHDRQVVEGSPHLAILTTPADSGDNWIAAGQALERVLLCATANEVSASFLNQPIQVPELRVRLRNIIGLGHPQILLRLGFGQSVKPTPRRAVSDVLETYLVDQWY
jgi:nitroreductase